MNRKKTPLPSLCSRPSSAQLLRLVGLVLALYAVGRSARGDAQERPGQPPVLTPPAILQPERGSACSAFSDAYAAAGRPRIMLFWNVRYDDQIAPTLQHVERIDAGVSAQASGQESGSVHWNGYTRSIDSSGAANAWSERVTGSRTVETAKQPDILNDTASVQLQDAFQTALRGAGMRLVNRDLTIRRTHATKDRSEANTKLVETDAVEQASEWLLQVTTLPDQEAPLRVGFALALTDVRSGTDLVSFYSRAVPAPAPRPVHYVARPDGFEVSNDPPPPTSPPEAGAELARETLSTVCLALLADTAGRAETRRQ